MERSGYHCGQRYKFDRNDPSVFGVEIEVDLKRAHTMSTFLEEAIGDNKITAEYDGSLSHSSGVEFIFQPLPFNQIVSGCHLDKWASYCKGKVKARTVPGHGMHISMNVGPWTNLNVGKFCWFFNHNKAFFQRFANRDYYYRESGNMDACNYMSKSNATNYVSSQQRLEIRIFQSSSNFRVIRRRVELLNSVRLFVEASSIENLTLDNYLNFLQTLDNHKLVQEFLFNESVAQ